MFATSCIKPRITKGLSHRYDPLSGWCLYGCGNRDDGRIVTREGNVIERGPQYTDPELAYLFDTASELVDARTPARTTR